MRTLIIVIPLILMIVIPLMFLVAVMLTENQSANAISRDFLTKLAGDFIVLDFKQQIFGVFTEFLCPLLLVMVAIICSVCCASCSFVLERDKFTLETLMLSPLNNKSIYHAKLSGSVIMSLIITLITFVSFMFFMIVANIMLSVPFFFSFEWLFLIFLLLPSVILFCSVLISLLAPKLKTVGESFQLMGYILLFFVLLYFLQFMGVYHINTLFVFLTAVIFLIADIILYNYGLKRFTPEKWLTDNFLKRLYKT